MKHVEPEVRFFMFDGPLSHALADAAAEIATWTDTEGPFTVRYDPLPNGRGMYFYVSQRLKGAAK